MKIHELHLTAFGKFKDKKISFSEGINYIYGENEAGKSTVMAFIKAMLYGFSGRGAEGDRKRYAPWDGTRMSGEMTVSLRDGRRVIIARAVGRTPAQDTLSILDAVTGAPVEVNLAAEIGVGESAFLKTVFVKQLSSNLDGGDEELTDKLLNLAGTGDADTGYDEAKAFLKDSIRIYKHQRGEGGRIYEIKKELSQVESEVLEAESRNREFATYLAEEKETKAAIESLENQKSIAEAAVLSAKAFWAEATLKEANKRFLAMREGAEETEALLSEVNNKKEALSAFDTPIEETVYAPIESTEELHGKVQKAKKTGALYWTVGTVSAILSVILAFTRLRSFGIVTLLAAILLLAFGIHIAIKRKECIAAISAIENKEEARRAALAAYGCASIKEYTDKMAEKLSLDTRAEALREKRILLESEAERAKEAVRKAEEAKAAFSEITPEERDISAAEAEKARIDALLAEKIRRAATLEGILGGGVYDKNTVDVLLSEKSRLLEELAEAEKTYTALCLAEKTLEEVFTELSHNFTPRICAAASEYLKKLTGQEESLLLDKKYAVTMGRGEHKPLWAFSGGTMDQAFLAVRLALSELVLADPEMPVFLDDSFLQYDAKREENALSLLREIAKERQVFWFSCRTREIKDMQRIEL